jgi:hypothetical protein
MTRLHRRVGRQTRSGEAFRRRCEIKRQEVSEVSVAVRRRVTEDQSWNHSWCEIAAFGALAA